MIKFIEYIIGSIAFAIGVLIAVGLIITEDRQKQILAGGFVVWLILALNMLASHV